MGTKQNFRGRAVRASGSLWQQTLRERTCPGNHSVELVLELGLRALLSVLLLSYHSLLRILPPPGSVRQDGSASASHLAQAALEKALFIV